MKEDKAEILRSFEAEFKSEEKELNLCCVPRLEKEAPDIIILVINSMNSKTLRECWPHRECL